MSDFYSFLFSRFLGCQKIPEPLSPIFDHINDFKAILTPDESIVTLSFKIGKEKKN